MPKKLHKGPLKLYLLALLVLSDAVSSAEWTFIGAERVVAVSDIHGAYDQLVETLQGSGVIDTDLAWSGGATHLVVVGDILDRGPRSRAAMDLLMRLETEAASAGGNVHVLIGNHESMNLVGDLRYVSKEEYKAFADDETEAERNRWFDAWAARGATEGGVEPTRERFDDLFPAGFFAHRKAFASDRHYGRWLLDKPVIVVINGNAFVHGGLSPMVAELGLDGVNGTLVDELRRYVAAVETLVEAGILLPTDGFYEQPDRAREGVPDSTPDTSLVAARDTILSLHDSRLHALEGPLWYRGNADCSALIEVDRLDASLTAIGASRVVIGHTPTRSRQVLQRFDGRIIEVDTGMLTSYYGGKGNALVMQGDTLSVRSQGSPAPTTPAPHPRYVGERPPGLDTAGIEALLAKGTVIDEQEDVTGRRIVSVSDGTNTVQAVFDERRGRGFYPDVAAYRLDRLIGLDAVPVAVRRDLGGADGSLRFLPANTVDEALRKEMRQGGSAWCPLPLQWDAMMVFDALIFNEGRTSTSVHYDLSTWQLILGDHFVAFGTGRGLPAQLAESEFAIGPAWQQALGSLTEQGLADRLGDVLDGRRTRALLARRDRLLESAD